MYNFFPWKLLWTASSVLTESLKCSLYEVGVLFSEPVLVFSISYLIIQANLPIAVYLLLWITFVAIPSIFKLYIESLSHVV